MTEVTVYPSFEELPCDDPPEWEGNDRLTFYEREGMPRARTLLGLVAAPADGYGMVVPFPGLLHEGDKGDPVYGVKRIVHRATGTLRTLQLAPPAQRRRWGRFFTMKVTRVQGSLELPATGRWNRATHEELGRFADDFAIRLLTPKALTRQERQRRSVLAFLTAFYNGRYGKRYSQERPSQLRPADEITQADCSGSVAAAMHQAGVLPEIDWRWTNTDTQIHYGVPVARLADVEIGDVVFYGRGSDPGHETCVVAVEPEIKVFSFGSYPAKILPIDYDRGGLGGRIAIRRFIL